MPFEKDQCHVQKKKLTVKKNRIAGQWISINNWRIVAICSQRPLNKCNLHFSLNEAWRTFFSFGKYSPWGGPWNNFESTLAKCVLNSVILVCGVTQLKNKKNTSVLSQVLLIRSQFFVIILLYCFFLFLSFSKVLPRFKPKSEKYTKQPLCLNLFFFCF